MSNDLGGKSKWLWSVDDGVNDSGAMSGYVAADLLTQDTARAEATSSDTSLHGARIWITRDGKIGYDAATLDPAFLALGVPGQYLTDTFRYAIRLGNGTLSWATATVQIAVIGSQNHAAVIGDPTVDDVIEDVAVNGSGNLTAAGTISISDADAGQAAFQTTVGSAPGNLGTLTLAADGSYTYSVANGAVQYLAAGDTRSESFTVTSADGTTRTVTFTIHGADDGAVIGDPTVHDVTEDLDGSGNLTAVGTISISDADAGQAAFQTTVGSAPGNLGTLTLAADGSYTYSVANSAVQYLAVGDTTSDSFTVTSADGTTTTIIFTIHGADDGAVIGNPTVHDVTEDVAVDGSGKLTATGTIPVSDPDQGQAAFQTAVDGAPGNLGSLVLAADGGYAYSVANSAVQYLTAGDTRSDSFTVTSADGTTSTVTFTIHGADDGAVIGDPTVHDVTEDVAVDGSGNLTAVGTISVSDPDQGQAALQTAVSGAPGNLGSLVLAADGSYSYSVANSAVQYLGLNDSTTDHFTITSLDGTTRTVAFTVHGGNDAPTVTGAASGSVTEDSPRLLQARGTLVSSDPDGGSPSWSIVGGATTAQTQDFRFQVDNLKIIRAGNLFFEDTFGDGNPPPSSPFTFPTGPATYTTNGTFTEAAGRAFFDGTQAVVFGTSAYGERMTLNTNTNPLPDGAGLKRNADFSTEACFDLITPEDGGDAYGVRLVDQPPGNQNSSVDLVLLRDATGVHVALRQINLGTGAVTVLEQQDLPAGTFDQIVFKLNYLASSYVNATAGGKITASFDLMSGGVVTASSSLAAQGTIFQGEDFTRVQLIGQSNQNETGVYMLAGSYGTLTLAQNGQWHYFLADHQANVQALGPGQTATDTFTVRVDDGHGGVTDKQIVVAVNGRAEPVVAFNDARAISENDNALVTVLANDIGAGLTLTAIGPATVTNPFGLSLGLPSLSIGGNQLVVEPGTTFDALGAGQFATLTVPYTVRDADGATATAQATITINGVNDPPLMQALAPVSLSFTEDDAVTLASSGFFDFSDLDLQDTHAVSARLLTSSGYLSPTAVPFLQNAVFATLVDPATGDGQGQYRWDFSLDSSLVQYLGFGQTLILVYGNEVTDTSAASVSRNVIVTITGVNDAPIVQPDSGQVVEAGTLLDSDQATFGSPFAAGHVLLNASDPELDFLSVSGLAAGTTDSPLTGSINFAVGGGYGALTIGPNGIWSYQLDNSRTATQALAQGEVVTDVFTYTVIDGHGGFANETITIDVTGANDAPAVSSPLKLQILEGSGAHQLDLLAGASDAEGDSIHVAVNIVAGMTNYLTLDADGHTLTFDTNHPDFNVLPIGDFFDFVVGYDLVDSYGAVSHEMATFRVAGTDDAPTVSIVNGNAVVEAGGTNIGVPFTQAMISYSDPDFIGLGPGGTPLPQFVWPDTAGWTENPNGTWSKVGIYGTATWTYGLLSYQLDNNDPDTIALGSDDNVYDTFTVTYTDGTLSTSRDVSFEVVGRNDMDGELVHWDTYYPTNEFHGSIQGLFHQAVSASFLVDDDLDDVELTGFFDADTDFTATQWITTWHNDIAYSWGGNVVTIVGPNEAYIGYPVDDNYVSVAHFSGEPFNGHRISGLPVVEWVSVTQGPNTPAPRAVYWFENDLGESEIWVDIQGLTFNDGDQLIFDVDLKPGTPINAPAVNPAPVDVGATDQSIGPTITIDDGFTFDLNVAYSGTVQFQGPTGTLKFEQANFSGAVDNFVTNSEHLDFSAITQGNASIVGEIPDTELAAHSIGWITNGADITVYVNASDHSQSIDAADMEVHMRNLTQLHNGDFIV